MFIEFKVVRVKSKNFESRKGNKKEQINKLMFIEIKNRIFKMEE